jgi:hypothetical protein
MYVFSVTVVPPLTLPPETLRVCAFGVRKGGSQSRWLEVPLFKGDLGGSSKTFAKHARPHADSKTAGHVV